ncbi:MAG: hypothetical protein QOG54_2321 [Actinomycetota bacterium]|jgi:hypothetical protein|nr:hypothetical protein [Actinomycetota bacterium]
MPRRRHRFILLSLVITLIAGVVSSGTLASARDGVVEIRPLSNRADLVSGDDVLVKFSVPDGANPSDLRISVNGSDVTEAFRQHSDGEGEGVLSGLDIGRNEVAASLPDGRGAQITITNHPIGGPVFAGPQIQPWVCQDTAKDKQCNEPPTFEYLYKPVTGGTLQPYDPDSPPPSGFVAETTTTEGVTVPFIVRQETGYIDRDQYAIATLYQPEKKWEAWAPQKQFNHRLVITHGASCNTEYLAGSAPDVQEVGMLGAGFIVMSNALDNSGHNCNLLVQAESLVMTKEYAIDHYGTVRWTIGSGCSGGSLVQLQVANAYPGLYQGVTPQCTFTDAWSSAMQYVDYDMLLRYFKDPGRWDPGTVWTPSEISAVLDHPNIGNPVTFTSVIPNGGDPSRSCPGVPAEDVYDPKTNPKGVRCTLQDYTVNAVGRRSKDGFANRPFDNVGIQYGLKGLREGLLTPGQFVDLNSHIGGLDMDGEVQKDRSSADIPGLVRAYTSGLVDSANNLDQVAIIDLRGPDPGAFHDVYRTYALRARLLRNFGTAANQVLWRGQVPLLGDVNYVDESVLAIDKWLARVDADHREVPLAQKIIEDKPTDLADRCTDGVGTDIPSWVCDETVASYGTPRFGADEPITDDTLKCQLQPLRKDDYSVTFTDDQWKRLNKAFPDGVCNYAKRGVEQTGAISWLTYQDDRGDVIYGGRPLGPPPHSIPY